MTGLIDDLPRHAHVPFEGVVEAPLQTEEVVLSVLEATHSWHRLVLDDRVENARVLFR